MPLVGFIGLRCTVEWGQLKVNKIILCLKTLCVCGWRCLSMLFVVVYCSTNYSLVVQLLLNWTSVVSFVCSLQRYCRINGVSSVLCCRCRRDCCRFECCVLFTYRQTGLFCTIRDYSISRKRLIASILNIFRCHVKSLVVANTEDHPTTTNYISRHFFYFCWTLKLFFLIKHF